MTTQQVLDKLPDLSGSAAKLLIHRVATEGAQMTNRETMRETGIRKLHTLIQARRELKLSGLWDDADNGHTALPIMDTPMPIMGTPRITARLDAEVIHGEETNLRQRAMDADLMDASGAWQDRNSPINLRRAAQIAVLQAAWTEHFGQDLSIGQAKRLLQVAGDSAEAVYDQVEIVAAKPKKVDYPFRYIEAILTRPLPPRQAEPQVRPAVIGKPDEPQDYMMSEPSERSKMIQARLRAAGLLGREDDD